MSNSVQIEELPYHTDARGGVVEPLTPGLIPGQRNVHVVLTQPGTVRGNHFHKRGTEVFTVFGPALVRTREGDTVSDVMVPESAAWRFTIPPGVSHAIQNIGTGVMVLVAFNTEVHDRSDPDAFPDVILEP